MNITTAGKKAFTIRTVSGKCLWELAAQAPKLEVGGCTKEVFEWFNCHLQASNLDAKLAARMYQITRVSLRPARQWRKLYRNRKQTSTKSCYQASTMCSTQI